VTSWWAFPPSTREVQCDEKWAFVDKKQKHCRDDDPADAQRGDNWDHVAFDPQSRLVLSVVPGKRTAENTQRLVQDFKARTGGQMLDWITTDDYPAYGTAIRNAYGEMVVPPPTGRLRVVFGKPEAIQAALERSTVSRTINTAFIERHNATDRHRNARKTRKSYRFSKDWDLHNAATYFTIYSYNFCWPVRTLRVRSDDSRWQPRTPAMMAGLADHVWSLTEWLTFPEVQSQ
jgi:IS1 family transposase